MFYKTKITLLNANHELGPVVDFFMYMTLFGVRVLFMEISMHCRSIHDTTDQGSSSKSLPFVWMFPRRWAAGFLGLTQEAEKGGREVELNLQRGKLRSQGLSGFAKVTRQGWGQDAAQFTIRG